MSNLGNFIRQLPVLGPLFDGASAGYYGTKMQRESTTQQGSNDKQQAEIQQIESYGQSLRAALSGNKIQDKGLRQQAQIELNKVSIFAFSAREGGEAPNAIDAEYKQLAQFMQQSGLQSDQSQGAGQQQNSGGGNSSGGSIGTLIHGVGNVLSDVGQIGGKIVKGVTDLIGSIF